MLGDEIRVPNGLGQLRKDTVYHFVGNSRQNNTVILTFFVCRKNDTDERVRYTVNVLAVKREEFEEGLSSGQIVVSEGSILPPWLARLKEADLYKIDAERSHAKIPYLFYVERRLLYIQVALDHLNSIFSTEDIESTINAYARSCVPEQNVTRFRFWLLTYLSFGRNIWALLPPFDNIGRWNRRERAKQKQGAPSIAFGRNYGYGMTSEMAAACRDGYMQYKKPGYSFGRIYAEVMNKKFGCKTIKGADGTKEFYHPKGLPYPSYSQFYYEVMKTRCSSCPKKSSGVGSTSQKSCSVQRTLL